MLAFLLAQLDSGLELADAGSIGEIAASTLPFPASSVLSTIGAALLAILGWLIQSRVRSIAIQKALTLILELTPKAVSVTWQTYTASKKAASADGKLTDAEKSIARGLALSSLLVYLGSDGISLVKKAFGSKTEVVLAKQIDSTYDVLRTDPPVIPSKTEVS